MADYGKGKEKKGTLLKRWDDYFFRKFTLRDAIFLGFCAIFIVITRAGLRLHFNIPGHAMFFMCFFLLLAAGCVPKMWAATIAGLVAGIVAVLLGMGQGGPLMLLRFILPGIVIDVARTLFPRLVLSFAACAVVGVLAAASRFLTIILPDLMAGMEWGVVVQHAMVSTFLGMGFGGLGAALVPAIVRRLRDHNIVKFPAHRARLPG